MNTVYLVYNPLTGDSSSYNTKDEALEAFWNIVVSFALQYMNGTPYTIIEQLGDGIEKCYTDKNQEIQSPWTSEEIEAIIEKSRQ